MYTQDLRWNVGEKLPAAFEIACDAGETFTPSSASYKVKRADGTDVVGGSGTAETTAAGQTVDVTAWVDTQTLSLVAAEYTIEVTVVGTATRDGTPESTTRRYVRRARLRLE